MRVGLKLLVVLVPIVLFVFALRACDRGSGSRWLSRVQDVDPAAVLAVDRPDLVAIAPSREEGESAGRFALAFRDALVREYGDLLGEPSEQKMVLVLLSEPGMVQAFAGQNAFLDRKSMEDVLGYTDPLRNLIVLPPERDHRVLRHEMVHLQMKLATGGHAKTSPWLSEGLAQYFERYDPPAPLTLSRQHRAYLLTTLGSMELDVERLIGMQEYRRFLVDSGPRNYRESLALVTYLMEAYPRERIATYLAEEHGSGADRARLFRQIFGDPGPMGSAVRSFLSE